MKKYERRLIEMLIYKITNTINNKCYIGQTIKSAEERWKEHQRHAFGSHPNDKKKTLYIKEKCLNMLIAPHDYIVDNHLPLWELKKKKDNGKSTVSIKKTGRLRGK